MKAWVLHGINDLRLDDVPAPEAKDGEVLVRVKAAGICSSDIDRVYTAGAYHYPIILGHEFCGVTPDGRRVGVFPLLPCFKCDSCRRGIYETCDDYSYIGSRRDGAFAEYVSVPEWNLIDLPDGVTFEQAALLEPAAVAVHAVKTINMPGAETAAVIGNGVIGKMIGMRLEQLGWSVDVLGRNDKNSRQRYDVCVLAAGTSASFERCVNLARQNGAIILVGNPDMGFNIARMPYWRILRKQLTVSGSWNCGYPADWQDAFECLDKLRLDSLISHKYEFDELDKAFEMIRSKRENRAKVIVFPFAADKSC